MVSELTRCVDELRLRGIKLYDHSGYPGLEHTRYPLLHRDYARVYDFAARHAMPILFHSLESAAAWRTLCTEFPETQFIWAHAGGLPSSNYLREETLDILAGQRNLYWDLTSPRRWGTIELLVERVGADRVLFGSDMAHIDGRAALGRVLHSDLEPAVKARVLGQNATDLFNLPMSGDLQRSLPQRGTSVQ